jgi:hypothetical protein
MNETNTKILDSNFSMFYPEKKQKRNLDEPFTLFKYQCGDNWFPILFELFDFLKFNVENNDFPKIIIQQIKVKWNFISFYYDIEPFENVKWTNWRSEKSLEWKLQEYEKNKQQIKGIINFAKVVTNKFFK